jgi:hypothetical protein
VTAHPTPFACPCCRGPLEQLGDVVVPSVEDPEVWVPSNLYRCQDCPFGKNRYRLDDRGKLVAVI